MAELNLSQLLLDAKTRWLKPVEICELLNKHRELPLSADAPNKPQSGSLFLFDRSKLRYFRKDGHNWRKKKDGKTVREAHEKLKAGSKDVIHCYYAHGEDNPKFQRRCYWLLERSYEHIVLVHYREVTEGNRSEFFQVTFHAPSLEGSSITDLSQKPLQNVASSSTSDSLYSSVVSSPSEGRSSILNPYEDIDATESGEEREDFQMASVEHSKDLPKSLLEQLTMELGLNSRANQQGPDASFLASRLSNISAASKPMAYDSYSNVTNAGTFDITQLPHNVQYQTAANKESYNLQLSYKGDLESLENMDMGDLLQGTDGFSNSNKISTSNTLDSSSWSSLLESTFGIEDKFMSLTEHADQPTAPHTANYLESEAPNVLNKDVFTGTRGLPASPSERIEKQPETTLEVQLRAMTEQGPFSKDALKPIKKEFQSHQNAKQGVLKDKNECKPWQQEEHAQYQSQHLMHEKQEPFFINGKPFDISIEIQSIDSGLLSPHVSELMQSIQFDGSNNIEKEEFPDILGKWMPKESEDENLNSLPVDSSRFPDYWVQCEDQGAVIKDSRLSEKIQFKDPMLLQKKCISIVDFTPEWSYCSDETKVIVTGIFHDTLMITSDTRWCCVFGGIEVPAEVLLCGVLRCKAPIHEPGRVPFYVTSKDRVFCSEVQEFEFRSKSSGFPGESERECSIQEEQEMLLQIRFARLVSTTEDGLFPKRGQEVCDEVGQINKQGAKAGSLVVDDNVWTHMENLVKEDKKSFKDAKENLLHTLLKSKLQQWLVRRSEDPKGVSILDDHGFGILHMAGALGYEWAVTAILDAGGGINFRDARGWTGLHWAAHFGWEKLVAFFVAAGANPGALTDPSPGNPTGHTAADLAASSGHGGIAGYLAETSLTSHLSSLNLQDGKVDEVFALGPGDKAVEVVSEKSIVSASSGVTEDQLSMKDTLAAVRNASQAAARIQAAFRVYSFRKRQEVNGFNNNDFRMLEEVGQDFIAIQTAPRTLYGQHDKMNLAATQIQCKYRGWKGRKDFLFLKKHVLRIQAHVRGHQVRKKYPKLLWTVGILDKVILRWRRKGQGLRGFHCEEDEDGDDEDFLRDFRRQKEEAFEEALRRVKVMLQDPKAQNQYRRMLEMYQNEKEAMPSEDLIFPDDEIMRLLE